VGAWRPSLQQLMALAGQIAALPADELAMPDVLRRARLALAVPNAEVYGVELYPDIPAKAGALAAALLANPPRPQDAAQFACDTARGFVRRNGWEWRVPVTVTRLRFEEELRRGQISYELSEWVSAQVAPKSMTNAQKVQRPEPTLRLFGEPEPDLHHVVYLAGPLAGLPEHERGDLLELGAGVEVAVAEVAEKGAIRPVLRVEHPSVRLSHARAPGLADRALWDANRKVIIAQTDALIVSDVGINAAGFGAAMEIDLMALVGGPVLYLRSRHCRQSRYLLGRDDELDLTVLDYRHAWQARPLVRQWLTDRSNAIEETGRSRADRIFEARSLLRRLAPAWHAACGDERQYICGALRVAPTLVERALSDPASTILLSDRLPDLCQLLGVEDGRPATPGIEGPDDGALVLAAAECGWEATYTAALRARAMDEWQSTQGLPRRTLATPQEWIRYARDLGAI
jgi:hypothetical protein